MPSNGSGEPSFRGLHARHQFAVLERTYPYIAVDAEHRRPVHDERRVDVLSVVRGLFPGEPGLPAEAVGH